MKIYLMTGDLDVNIAAVVDAAIAGQRTTYADIREKTLRYMVSKSPPCGDWFQNTV